MGQQGIHCAQEAPSQLKGETIQMALMVRLLGWKVMQLQGGPEKRRTRNFAVALVIPLFQMYSYPLHGTLSILIAQTLDMVHHYCFSLVVPLSFTCLVIH